MDDVYVYFIDLPEGVNEMVCPCADGGYTVYLDSRQSEDGLQRAYAHAVDHIQNMDYEKSDVQSIESSAHNRKGGS